MKHLSCFMIFFVLSILFTACKKSDTVYRMNQTQLPSLRIDSTNPGSFASEINSFAYKIGDWEAYPYYTDSPDEDSFFNSWSPPISDAVYKKITKVFIKMTDGSIEQAPQFVQVDGNSKGYLFQFGESLCAKNRILLWWIQKVDGTRPTADSCFFQ